MAILRRRPWLMVLALATLSATLAHGADQPDPRSRAVALHPLVVPNRVSDPAAVQSLFESLMDRELRLAGYTTVPSTQVDSVWNRMADSLGGIFDPNTGEVDESRRSALAAVVWRDLHVRFGVEVVLYPQLEVVGVQWKGGKARWDGVSEGVAPVGAGVVPCLTLTGTMEDSLGVSAPLGRGGLQALAKASTWKNRWAVVPREKLFADEKRNLRAVRLALEPLLRTASAVE